MTRKEENRRPGPFSGTAGEPVAKPRSAFAWSAGPEPLRPRGHWHQFELRTLLILAAAVGVACGILFPLLTHR